MPFQLDTLFVWVNDLDRSVEWYSKLGVEAGPRHGPWQEMKLGGEVRFALHLGERLPGESTAVPALRVDDLDHEMSRLAELGIRSTDREITDTGTARFAGFHDPDGNEIQLMERR